MLGKVDTHIAVSNAVAADLHRQLNITKHKITVVPNSVGFDEPVPVAYPVERHLLLAPGTTNLALTLARLSDEKGLPYLIRAAVQCPNVTFLIAGVGPQLEQLEADARALGVDARVRFLGYRTDVQHLLSISDMFILPSLCEGLPLSVLEAMAAGKPVIASSLPAIEEAVVHGCTGLLVPPRDPSALARAITELASDSCLAYTLGFAASADVKARFSRQSMISSVSSVYLS
jgi:glycosyltransferase involved in cell wall biosynthesis